jgi:hypothetical protein
MSQYCTRSGFWEAILLPVSTDASGFDGSPFVWYLYEQKEERPCGCVKPEAMTGAARTPTVPAF